MAQVMAGMTVSLDGYMEDDRGQIDRLHPDFEALRATSLFQTMVADTGAVIMGRRVYEMADPFLWANDDYEFQVPLFVVTHRPPAEFPPGNGRLGFTFVTEGPAEAVAQARRAAGDRLVQVIGGGDLIRQCLEAGLCDLLQIDVMPVLLGGGLRLFDRLDARGLRLERLSADLPTAERTSLLFSVSRGSGVPSSHDHPAPASEKAP